MFDNRAGPPPDGDIFDKFIDWLDKDKARRNMFITFSGIGVAFAILLVIKRLQ